MFYDPDSLLKSLIGEERPDLPPVHLWHPESVQDIGLRIASDGTWFHQGMPIRRQRMVRLFSTVMRRDDDGFYLVTPAEKIRVDVDLVPFVAVRMEAMTEPGGPAVAFQTNVDDVVVVDKDHPLWVEEDERGNPLPLVRIRDGLDALLTRSVFYELAEAGTIRTIGGREVLGVTSRGRFFELGVVDA